MIELEKGSERLIPMEITRRQKEIDFTVESVNCEVYNTLGTLVESGVGTFEGHQIYYFLDTSQAIYEVGKIYAICFSVTIVGLNKTIKGARRVKIITCY